MLESCQGFKDKETLSGESHILRMLAVSERTMLARKTKTSLAVSDTRTFVQR